MATRGVLCVLLCSLNTGSVQHHGRFFQSPKMIVGLINILLHGQPASEGGRRVAGFVAR